MDIDQPDNSFHPEVFEPYMNLQQPRQSSQKEKLTQSSHNMQSQYYTNNQRYQPESMKNETPLPYYSQTHEITKNHLTSFIQKLNTAEDFK